MKNLDDRLAVMRTVRVPDLWGEACMRSNRARERATQESLAVSRSNRAGAFIVAAVAFALSVALVWNGFSGAPAPRSDGSERGATGRPLFVSFESVDGSQTQILALSPDTSEVLQEFTVGSGASLAPAPDGSRLYVLASAPSGANDLLGFDVASGKEVLTVPLLPTDSDAGERVQHVGPYCCQTAAVSTDGRILFYVVYADSTGHQHAISAISTSAGEPLGTTPSLGECAPRQIVPVSAQDLAVVCGGNNLLMKVSVNGDGVNLAKPLSTPDETDRTDPQGNPLYSDRVAAADIRPGSDQLFAVSGNGVVFQVDVPSWRFVAEHSLELRSNEIVPAGRVSFAPSGDRFYVGLGSTENYDDAEASLVREYDPTSWAQLAEHRTADPFYLMLAVGDGEVWLMNPEEDGISRVDTASGAESPIPVEVVAPTGRMQSWAAAR